MRWRTDLDDRLHEEDETFVDQGPFHALFPQDPVLHRAMALVLEREQVATAATRFLGLVQGQIGVGQKVLHGVAVLRK